MEAPLNHMKAVHFNTSLKLVTNNEIPVRSENEAIIRVTRAGICNTDLEIIKGYMGFQGILGHEFVGVIEEIGTNDRGLSSGMRVVGEINLACENCKVCQAGGIMQRNHCPNRTVLGILNKSGTFAEYLTLPMKNLYQIPDEVGDRIAVFAEPLAAAFRIAEQIQTHNGQKIAVIGDGKLGNLITQVMTTLPHSSITLFGKHENKLNRIPQKQVEKRIVDDETASHYSSFFDVCVEASGSPSGLIMAAEITKSLGTIILKSTCALGTKEFNTAPFVIKEINIIGSRCGNFPMAIKALQEKRVLVEELIDKEFPMDDALEAFKAAEVKGTMKIQVVM